VGSALDSSWGWTQASGRAGKHVYVKDYGAQVKREAKMNESGVEQMGRGTA